MPQACDDDRDIMLRWFGDDTDGGCIRFLKSHGFVLNRGWTWTKPTPAHNLSTDERRCVFFLIEEWDFGGIVG